MQHVNRKDNVLRGSALETQEGGSHYKSMRIQPVEFVTTNKIGFIEGSVIKYVCRHRNKNGAEDIKKAVHFLNLLLELEYPETILKESCTQIS